MRNCPNSLDHYAYQRLACPASRWRGTSERWPHGRRRPTYEPPRWHQRLLVQGMEGLVLPRGLLCETDAALLRRALRRRGDQQLVLSHANRVRAGGLDRRRAVALQVRVGGAAA